MWSDPFKSDHTKSDRIKWSPTEKNNFWFEVSKLRKAGTPDGVEAPVGGVVHQVDVDDEVLDV